MGRQVKAGAGHISGGSASPRFRGEAGPAAPQPRQQYLQPRCTTHGLQERAQPMFCPGPGLCVPMQARLRRQPLHRRRVPRLVIIIAYC